MLDMFITGMENENDLFDFGVKIICVSTFLKIQTNFSKYRPNTDQFLTFFEKVCITDQNYFYRPLCHHWDTMDKSTIFETIQQIHIFVTI